MAPGALQPAGGVWESEGGFPNYAIFYVVVQDVAVTVERAEKLGAQVLMAPVSGLHLRPAAGHRRQPLRCLLRTHALTGS
ncbi:hypothetical protein ACIP2Y_16705 [Streptomyces sviceus]|uniref:hypothetical protein n=1 Tax=Streptomyces sviceus TaxID=285530 RepID=UPI00380A0A2A